MAISNWFGGGEKELLPKDILVDLESNINRADEMLEKFVKGESPGENDFSAGVTASSAQMFFGVSELERAMRQMEIENMRQRQLAAMQNQQGGIGNGFSNQGLGNALGGLGGFLGPSR